MFRHCSLLCKHDVRSILRYLELLGCSGGIYSLLIEYFMLAICMIGGAGFQQFLHINAVGTYLDWYTYIAGL